MAITKLGVAKFIASGIVGLGTGKIVRDIIKENVTPKTLVDKVAIAAATWAIAGIATKQAKKHTDEWVDDAFETITMIKSRFELKQKVNRLNRGESTLEDEGLTLEQVRQNDEGKWEINDEEKTEEKKAKHEKPDESD